MMKKMLVAGAVCVALLSGCKKIDGQFAPACIAFEGDRITLKAGRYDWNKFTDERVIDASGNVVDPFPQYPKSGAFIVSSQRIDLLGSNEEVIASFYLHTSDSQLFMLTERQYQSVSEGKPVAECALVRSS